jgi:hypothetical protein
MQGPMLLTLALLVSAVAVAALYVNGARTRAAHLGSMSVSWLAERRMSSRS